MSLKKTIQKAAITAFKTAGDIVIKVLYTKITDNGFEDATTVTQELSVIREDKKTGAYVNHWESLFAEKILITDIICTTPVALCVLPVEEDADVLIDGYKYTVKAISADPADAIYTMLLRKA